jgi:hypothetical protein
MLHGVDQQARAFANEVGIQRLPSRNLLSQQVAPVLMPRCDPRPDGRAECADERTSDSRQGSDYPRIYRCSERNRSLIASPMPYMSYLQAIKHCYFQ